MDIAKLKELIEGSLDGSNFDLDTAELLSADITAIAEDYLADARLKLSGASIPTPESDSITVKGTGVELPFKDLDIEARFYILNNEAALTLTGRGGAGWTLDQSIPAFKGTLGASVRFTVTPAPPSLFLLSNPQDDKPTGLWFSGTIDFAAMSAGISGLLGIATESVNGPVVLKNKAAEFVSIDFDGPVVTNVDLWVAKDCSVEFKMESYVLPNPISKTSVPIPNITLVTNVPFSTYKLPVSVQIINLSSSIRFSADITDLVNASLDALGKFAGNVDLKSTIPSTFHIEDYLKFTSLFLDFDPKGKAVDMIGLEVQSTVPWKILEVESTGKTFNAKNMVLSFSVLTPFSAPQPYLYLGGEITLTDNASLYISAAYPNFEIQGYLTENSVLSIKEFVAQFVGDPVGIPEILFVEELSFDLMADDYSFGINLTGYWPINGEQSLSLIVKQMGFAVQYSSSEKTASFSGVLQISTVDITVTADYSSTDAGSGWVFTGATGPGQVVFIGDFIAYLTETFGIGEPPAWIKGITLQDLYTSFNTLTKDFEFSITGNIPIAANNDLQIKVGFAMTAVTDGYEKQLSGSIDVGKSKFDLVFSTSPSDTSLSASWTAKDEGGYIKFEDIASAFGFKEFPTIPDGLDLDLKEAKLFYDFTDGKQALVLAAASANYGNAVFVAKKIDNAWTYVFGIDIEINIDLGSLPLVGSDIEAVVGKVGLNGFKLVGATKQITAENIPILNKLIADNAGADYPTLPDVKEGIEAGVYAAIDLNLGKDNNYELQLSTATKKAPKTGLLAAADAPAKDDNAYWVNLQKAIGPVYFDKAGVAYKDGRISLLLDASLVFTALRIDMIGLGVSNPLKEFAPSFELNGLNIAYQSGPVQISAGFLKSVVDGITEYSGMAVIGVQAFNLSALGSYASVDGHPSLFIFAMLTAPPLGGPPCFFVTGVAAGFGYNRGLRLPSIDGVSKFPLVMGFVPSQKTPFSGPDPGAALKILIEDDVVPVSIGQNWVAAGVQFTSFQLLQSFALLSVAFGTNLEIGIIGMSTISVPPKSPVVVAYAQLAIAVKLLPDQGIFSVEAKLTPASYLLSTACVLTGGFAFYLWTAPNEHEGDFVVTLGGYHPDFTPPDYYPKVPRLGFNWTVTSEVSIKGGMYFALTPTCVMAGGSLEATFSSGDLKAWFIIGADFLIAWKPYHYQAHLYLSFGVSYTFSLDLLFTTITETISVSLGADLSVWGPEFSGIATIHLWIISFDISFGSTPNNPPAPISWSDFQESFLPASEKTLRHIAMYGETDVMPSDTYCYGKVTKGLVEDLTVGDKPNPDMSWIVNRNHTTLETYTIIPAKDYVIVIKDKNGNPVPDANLIYTNKAALDAINKDFGIGMVDVENDDFHSEHAVTIEFQGELNLKVKYEITAIIRSVPKSLWEKRETGFDENALVQNVLVGFTITPVAPIPDQSLPIDLLYFQYRMQPYVPQIVPAKPVPVDGPDNVDGMKRLKDTINSEPATTVRKNIIDSLIARGVSVNPDVDVAAIAAHAEDFYMAPPVLSYTYWKQTA